MADAFDLESGRSKEAGEAIRQAMALLKRTDAQHRTKTGTT